MNTNDETIYQVKHLFEQGDLSDDNGWSDIFIYDELLKYRARLLSQKMRQKVPVSSYNYQTIPCIKLIEVNKIDASIPDLDNSCSIYRSEFIIPKTIGELSSISNLLNSKEYPIRQVSQLRFKSKSRRSHMRDADFAYVKDSGKGNYLYIVSSNYMLEEVSTRGIYENPLEVQTYPNCDGEMNFPCRSFYDYEFILDDDLFATVKQMFLTDNYNIKYGPNDTLNNNTPNV